MILPHEFNEEAHIYTTPGRYCLSTSDVIDLNGLCDLSQVPVARLREANYRGKRCHKAIEQYERGEDWQAGFPDEYNQYMDGWFAFRDDYSIQLVGNSEQAYVYAHEGTDQAIGATIDLRFLYDGWLYIADCKFIHPVSGKALDTKKLAWRLQGQSYKEATEHDSAFLSALPDYKGIRRMFIHLHPKLKPTSRTVRGNGYQVHEFLGDDSLLWDSAVRVAMAKVSVGILPDRRNVDVHEMLEMSNA